MHLCTHLPEFLFVDSGNCQRSLILLNASLGREALGFSFDSFGQGKLNWMRVTQREDDFATLHIGLVTNSYHIHLLGKAFRDALDRVVGQSSRQAMKRGLVVRGTFCDQICAFLLESNSLRNWGLEHAFGALYLKLVTVNSHRDAFGNRNRFFCNTRHDSFPISDFQLPTGSNLSIGIRQLPIGNVYRFLPATLRRHFPSALFYRSSTHATWIRC